MLSTLAPLSIPTYNAHATRSRRTTQTATNTLHITHPSRTFFTPRSLSTLKAILATLAPSGILSFSPLKSLRRVIIVFASSSDARTVRTVLDGSTTLDAPRISTAHLEVDTEGDISMSSSESDVGEDAEDLGAQIRCYYGNETVIAEKKMLKVGEMRKRDFEGERAPEHTGLTVPQVPAVRKRSSSLVLLESDGRKPAIEVEEF